jgi:hypothetical protein
MFQKYTKIPKNQTRILTAKEAQHFSKNVRASEFLDDEKDELTEEELQARSQLQRARNER